MAILNGVFALLNVAFFILLIIGLIKPSIVKLKTRGKVFLIFFSAMIISGLLFNITMSDEQKQQSVSVVENKGVEQVTPVKTEQVTETIEAVEPKKVAEAEQSFTSPQLNAIRSAKQYLSFSSFSRNGLIDQLSSSAGDGYDKADATIAVDSLSVDWDEQAALSAKRYLEMTGFSCKGLIDQLSSSAGDKYTKDQATYGAQQAGACS